MASTAENASAVEGANECEFSDQRSKELEEVRRKTFVRWLNWRLEYVAGSSPVTDLFYDLRSGVVPLQILSSLSNTEIPVEHGEFRVQKLGNLSSVLGFMQKERGRMEGLEATRLLDGDPAQTLDLIWNIILRWELQPRFNKKEWENFSIDQILISWINSISPASVQNLNRDIQSGRELCHLVLKSHPNLPGLNDALATEVGPRWETLLKTCSKHLNTPVLLDFQDIERGDLDQKSIILYLGILFSSLPPVELTAEKIQQTSIQSSLNLTAKISGSPVKTQSRPVENVLTMDGWMNCLEEVLSWILEAEEHLLTLHNLGHRHLQTVKTKFYNHEDFMLELQNHQSSVGQVLSRGRELMTSASSPEDQIEIRLQMKVLIEKWERVRELAMAKQTELHQLIMSLQMEQITELKSWMTGTEDRISRLSVTGETKEEVEVQLQDLGMLQEDLENQHAGVSAISNFILVDSDDTSNIEDQLAGLGERWCMICRCIEERLDTLKRTKDIFLEQKRLQSYMQSVEAMLKEMELSEDVGAPQLQQQTRRILELETELDTERANLTQTGINTEYVQNRSVENDPGIRRLCVEMELLQDRWDVLIEILFAQKQRISKLGVEFSHQTSRTPEKVSGSTRKRRLTGSKRIEFETCYVRILNWSESILARIEDNVFLSLPLQDQNLLLEETHAEVSSQKEKVSELVRLGAQLEKDIVREEDFPKDYLTNVSKKVENINDQILSIESSLSRLKVQIDFQVEKDCFYRLIEELNKVLENFSLFSVEAEKCLETGNHSELKSIAEEKKSVLQSTSHKLEEIKQIGKNLTLQSVSDPENTVKRDLYLLCQSFESTESRFSSLLFKLESECTDSERIEPFNQEESETVHSVVFPLPVAERVADFSSDSALSEEKVVSVNVFLPSHDQRGGSALADAVESEPTRTENEETHAGESVREQERASVPDKLQLDILCTHESASESPGQVSDPICDKLSDRTVESTKSTESPGFQVSRLSVQVSPQGRTADHYEECAVSSTLLVPSLPPEKAEIFITMKNMSPAEASETKPNRDMSELELNLEKCDNYLLGSLYVQDNSSMEDEISEIHSYLKLLADAFVPASFTEDESARILEHLLQVKSGLRSREKEAKELLENLSQLKEEVSGLTLWMKEVRIFLQAEDVAIGDVITLEAQLKESNALQDDISTLEPNLENIKEMGASLLKRSLPESKFASDLKGDIKEVCGVWDSTISAARSQNRKLQSAYQKSREVVDLMTEINSFLDQLEQDLPREGVVTEAPELSQRTYKLLQLRDRTDRKSYILERLSTTVSELIEGESEGSDKKVSNLGVKLSEVQNRWSNLTQPVSEQYSKMREATTDYGEFKTLVAQESDWLDRLEKKLRRSSKCAADAEEISEELDDLENCLHNHPEDRLQRLKQLAGSLSQKDVLISPVQTETGRLEKRWHALERQAKERIRSLEECITEAQEWECKILAVQDWLSEKDILLTSHLEHELTVDDLPDETQKERMLREFEDKENILAEMDEQVDAYREAGKEEAASRLEDQLMLIHSKFQELSSKFELFQQPADYDGRLGRISRQLRDIQHNMYLTELISHEPDSIHGQLHHTRCIYNALADIKPEVEATIKMGRKLVEAGNVSDPAQTTKNIDALKELFNLLGAQVTEAREVLQKALEISEVLMAKLNFVNHWLSEIEKENESINMAEVPDKIREMKEMKSEVKEVLAMRQEFVNLCTDPTLLVGLKESLSALESKWSSVKGSFSRRLPESERTGVTELDLLSEDGSRFTSPANNSLNSSAGEEGIALQEFRASFQDVSNWLEKTEFALLRPRKQSEDRDLAEQIFCMQSRVESLGSMAAKIVEKFTSQRRDVEPEMEVLSRRFEIVLDKLEKSSSFSASEIEQFRTTITRLAIPPADPLVKSTISEPEEIATLPEEMPEMKNTPTSNDKDSSRDSSPEFFSASLVTPEKKVNGSGETMFSESPSKAKKTPPPTLPKPRWYVESLQETASVTSTCSAVSSSPSVPPVQHVTVTSSTLPSPRSLPHGNTVIEPQRKTTPVPIVSPVRTILPSVETSPSTSPVNSPVISAPQSILDDIDKQNERDNAIIDRLLRGTSADIEDVKARKSYTSPRLQLNRDSFASHSKDIKEFDEKYKNISQRIDVARRRFTELDGEGDRALRNDLIDMELQELEAEVATTISRGDTLVLRVHRFDAGKGEDLKMRVSQIRDSWTSLKQFAEEKKEEALREAENMDILKEKLTKMQAWLNDTVKYVKSKRNEEERLYCARKEIDRKSSDVKSIEKIASSFKSLDKLGDLKENLIFVRTHWGALNDLATPLRRSKSRSPRETVDKSVPAEIFTRITRMQEALTAVGSQLDTSIMNGKTHENLNLQAEVLEKVKQALETLRPKLKKTFADIDHVSGALSMEYFDKLTALGEKLRGDWKQVNEDYLRRENTWRECKAEMQRFSSAADCLSSWLTGKEKTVLLFKQTLTSGASKEELQTLLAEVKEKEREVEELTGLGLRISGQSGATQARDILNRYDNLRKRWRYVFTEISLKKTEERDQLSREIENVENGNVSDIVKWAEETLTTAGKCFNVSELEELKQGVTVLQSLQVSLLKQRVCLDELAAQFGENSTVYQSSKVRLDRVGVVLPKRLSYLTDKADRLVKMVEEIEESRRWIETIHQKYRSASSSDEHMSIRISLSEKEYSVNKLFNDYMMLEREVVSSGLPVNAHLSDEIKELKAKWLRLTGEVRRITPAQSTCQRSSNAAELPKTSSSHSVSSFVSLASLASPTSQSSEQWAASPTTASTSPMSEEVESLPVTSEYASQFSSRAGELTKWLNGVLESLGPCNVIVLDTEVVGKELDRYRALIAQVEAKKSVKEELIKSALELRTDAGKAHCDEIQILWSNLQQNIMSRKTELTAMLEHADNLNTKSKEVSQWLGKLEKMLSGAGIGKTRDVLLRQIREVNQIHRELQQYGHHVTLLSQVCHRLISIYTKDDTSGIVRTNKELTGRYSALTSSCTARGKSLQAALQGLNKFDQELADFLVWMGEVEASLESMESTNSPSRLDEVTREIRERDSQFRTLSNRSREQLGYSGDSDIVLSSKVEELNRRWTGLQNRILNLSDSVGKLSSRNRLELDDLQAWIRSKLTELKSLKVGKSLIEIKRQLDEHTSFRDKLKLKKEDLDNLNHKLMPAMESPMDEEWKELERRAEDWEKLLLEAEKSVKIMDQTLGKADCRLKELETNSTEWYLPPSLDTADAERDEVESTISGLHGVEELVFSVRLESDAKSFMDITERLAHIEKRLTSLKEAAVTRREQLSGLVVQQNPGNQEFLRSAVSEGWERCLTVDNIPYFSHHVDETTSWDHPEFVSLLNSLTAMNTVKYCAYRLALKLRKVQQKLCLDLLDIESVVVCFDAHGLAVDKHDLTIAVPEMVTILTSIYETLYQCEPEEINVPLSVDLCLNWILNVFDSQRTGVVRVLSFKLGLVLLCRGPLAEKYGVLFSLASGSDSSDAVLDQRRLGLLLYDCMQIPRYLGEIALFGGSNIEPSVRSCLQKNTHSAQNQVNLDEFLDWLREEPQSLVWLPVLHRLASAETATHDVKCKICRVDPIIGFRYHCRKCFNLDICHACFFLGKTVKGHKPEHPMQEYCTSTNRTDNARHLFQAFRNSFRSRKYFKKKQKKLGYLPVQTVMEGDNFESPAVSPNLSLESREFPGSTTESLSSKLAHENNGSVGSRNEDDEHSLIANYCRLLTNSSHLPSTATILRDVDTRLDTMEKEAVEQLLEQLHEENSRLETEYQELLSEGRPGQQDDTQEEKVLRQQKNRLEARMTILEDHNRQLEAQLDRLRQLVSTEPCNGAVQNMRFVVAAELHSGQHLEEGDSTTSKLTRAETRPPPVAPRKQPPTALNLIKVHEVDKRNSYRDSGTSGTTENSNRNSGTSGSLNLSQHNTDTQED